MAAPPLPQEILDLVINNLDADALSLKLCFAASPRLWPAVRRNLFHTVDVYEGRSYFRDAFDLWSGHRAQVLPFVRHVRLFGLDYAPTVICLCILQQLCKVFAHVTGLLLSSCELTTCDVCRVYTLPHQICAAVLSFVKCQNLP